jgi:hypothetical protein
MTMSWIGSDFADSDPAIRTPSHTSARMNQHSRSARNTVAAKRVGSGRFWINRGVAWATLEIAGHVWHARHITPWRARPARRLRINADLR